MAKEIRQSIRRAEHLRAIHGDVGEIGDYRTTNKTRGDGAHVPGLSILYNTTLYGMYGDDCCFQLTSETLSNR